MCVLCRALGVVTEKVACRHLGLCMGYGDVIVVDVVSSSSAREADISALCWISWLEQ